MRWLNTYSTVSIKLTLSAKTKMISTITTLTVILSAIIVDCNAIDKNRNDPDAIMFPNEDPMINPRMNYHHMHHHHHHHNHDLSNDDKTETIGSDNQEIPLSFIQQLNQIDNISVLINNYLDGESTLVDDHEISNRFGLSEKAAVIKPKPATCTPTLQTVELKNSNDTSIFNFPTCTRVERCGGCCSHSLLSCQPVAYEVLNYQVSVFQYSGGTKLKEKGKEIILVEKHTKCKCACIVKKEDCNSFQEYREGECRCICTNLDERKKCEKFNDTKLWDPNLCKCGCREITDCTSGFYFEQSKCACISNPVRRRFAELSSSKERHFDDKEKYDVVAPVAPISNESNQEKDYS